VLWDDIDPALLDVDQRQALLDWIHFGGQLIVSGPGTLDKLKGSFLDPSKEESFLPATASETSKLSPEEVARMANPWNTPGKNGLNGQGLVVARDWSVVALDKHSLGRYVEDTNQQVVERQIGRGRIVVTSFRIGQPSLLNWPSFDCFLNAVLLRRQARQFEAVPDSLSQVAMKWLLEDGSLSADTRDARLVTTLRWFSRDIDSTGKAAHEGRVSDLEVTTAMAPSGPFDLEQPATVVLDEQAEANAQGSGIGGWSDFAGVPAAARSSLREAAGIKIPNAAVVVFVLAVYLAVLVPLNWGIFRVVGRIELAWIAAPLIAIAGALSVIKLAELDIGFARSETEISMLEAHANYPRAHLTRYTALYASLGTTYDLVFEDKNALALPFPADEEYQRLRGEGLDRVEYRRDETGARLAGFTVKSNSTGMVHSEQMYDLGGVLSYAIKDGRHEVYNRTKYVIHNAGVIRRTPSHKLEVAWLGDLYPRQGAQASFTTAPSRRPLLPQWDLSRETTPESDRPLQRLLNLAQQSDELEPGEVRMLGIIREPLAGMSIEPTPSQSDRCSTLIVAHLKHAYLENHQPRPDANSRSAIKEELLDPEDE
jgi:hypothetical protein